MERGAGGRSVRLLVLLSLLACLSALAAYDFSSGGPGTQAVLNWMAGLGGDGEGDGAGHAERLLSIGGGGEGAAATGAASAAGELVPRDDGALVGVGEGKRRRGKRARLLDAGKAMVKVLQLPIKTVMGGLRKLLSLGGRIGRGGRGRGRQQQQQPQAAIAGHAHHGQPVKPNTMVDLDALTPEQRATVEETFEDLLSRPGLVERGAATKLTIDRDCVARYFIAEKWKPTSRAMAEAVAYTVRWREEERVAHLTADDVAAQAWNGYLYVNGTDRHDRPVIYYLPAYQDHKRPDKAIQYLVYTLERALDASRPAGVEAYSFIIDCQGFSLSTMPPVNLIKKVFQMLHHHYPTRVGFILFLNTGSAFQLLWKVLAPLVSPMTRNKILFVAGGQEARELLARIDPRQLEARYGGESPYVFDPARYFGLSAAEVERLALPPAPAPAGSGA